MEQEFKKETEKNMIDMSWMPKYKCHKTVRAFKIKNIEPSCGDDVAGPNQECDGGRIITAEENSLWKVKVDFEYVRKNNPQIGGYLVLYNDGYISFSPSEPFESGYTAI